MTNRGYVAWHNECGAIRFGRVIEWHGREVWTECGDAVAQGALVAGAGTLRDLAEQVDKHRAECVTCALASEALRVMCSRVAS